MQLQYSTLIRKKDKSYQYIITYKDNEGKWKTKSKQGYILKKEGKSLAQSDMDAVVLDLKKQAENGIDKNMIGITFKEFSTKHKEHLIIYREKNTVLALKTVLNHFEKLDKIEVSKITNLDIQPIVDKLTKSGIKSNTIEYYLQQLSTVFNSAVEYGIIFKTPIKNIKYNKYKEEINKRALNKVECEKILEDFKETRYYLLILIALKCGLRLGEILGLNWEDIDEINNVIKVTKQWKQLKDGSYGFGTLKSKNSYRDVPISPTTLTLLKNSTKVREINGRILNFKNTDSISICLNRLFRLGGYNITIHELRHTYATTLISNGAPYKVAAQFLGHTEQQTMKSYSHINDDMIKKATSIINNIL
ncbi:site-specific integrase [Clostridium sp.]|uniref:tyrosine-type recombinase/integrase n=1 Tax=Clostridium sp. TaxID=1506 RepID=UPI001A48F1F0|nr:site-specific integrase [Clostridium sp.]MBK5243357.1 site-specific integrase [Clostridium sp.]